MALYPKVVIAHLGRASRSSPVVVDVSGAAPDSANVRFGFHLRRNCSAPLIVRYFTPAAHGCFPCRISSAPLTGQSRFNVALVRTVASLGIFAPRKAVELLYLVNIVRARI